MMIYVCLSNLKDLYESLTEERARELAYQSKKERDNELKSLTAAQAVIDKNAQAVILAQSKKKPRRFDNQLYRRA